MSIIRFLASCFLNIIPVGRYGTRLYNALARLTVSIAFEAVAVRLGKDQVLEVFLKQRSLKESAYPGEWHCPGSTFRPNETATMVVERLSKTEFKTAFKSFIRCNQWEGDEARGWYVFVLYLVEFENEPKTDECHQWFPVNALPAAIVEHHRDVTIPMVVDFWKTQHPQYRE